MDAEHAERIVHEVEYWRAVLADLEAVNATAMDMANDIGSATVALLSLISLTDARANEFVRDGMTACNTAMSRVLDLQTQITSALKIIEGRTLALRREGDGG